MSKATIERMTPTDGDPLAQAAVMAGVSNEQLRCLRRWLAEQLLAHEYAKLGEGGHKQTQVPLKQVFVDLPVTTNPSADLVREERPLFLQRLLASPPIDLRESFKSRSEKPNVKHSKIEEDEDEESDPFSETGESKPHTQLSASVLNQQGSSPGSAGVAVAV